MLKFKMSEIKPILEHAEQAPQHQPLYGNPGTDKPGLFFVKDDGVYLMSNGNPPLPNPDKATNPQATSSLVCYAEGHDPRQADTWDHDRAECGGDDFGEFIDATTVRTAFDKGCKWMSIRINKKTFSISFS